MRVSGTFNATGAAMSFALGFLPDWVRVWNLENTTPAMLEWSKNMARAAEMIAGLKHNYLTDADTDVGGSGGSTNRSALTSSGISLYTGATSPLSAVSTTLLVKDVEDKRAAGSGNVINKWTLDTPGSKTGKFNAGVNTTYVGEGSLVKILQPTTMKPIEYQITSITNDGDADDEVTLNAAAPSGIVLALGPMYDWRGAVAGEIPGPGFTLAASITYLNVSGNMCFFEAGKYGN